MDLLSKVLSMQLCARAFCSRVYRPINTAHAVIDVPARYLRPILHANNGLLRLACAPCSRYHLNDVGNTRKNPRQGGTM